MGSMNSRGDGQELESAEGSVADASKSVRVYCRPEQPCILHNAMHNVWLFGVDVLLDHSFMTAVRLRKWTLSVTLFNKELWIVSAFVFLEQIFCSNADSKEQKQNSLMSARGH